MKILDHKTDPHPHLTTFFPPEVDHQQANGRDKLQHNLKACLYQVFDGRRT
jgi:hypothetical protein